MKDMQPHTWECVNCGATGELSRTENWDDLTCDECWGAVAPMVADSEFYSGFTVGKLKGAKAS